MQIVTRNLTHWRSADIENLVTLCATRCCKETDDVEVILNVRPEPGEPRKMHLALAHNYNEGAISVELLLPLPGHCPTSEMDPSSLLAAVCAIQERERIEGELLPLEFVYYVANRLAHKFSLFLETKEEFRWRLADCAESEQRPSWADPADLYILGTTLKPDVVDALIRTRQDRLRTDRLELLLLETTARELRKRLEVIQEEIEVLENHR